MSIRCRFAVMILLTGFAIAAVASTGETTTAQRCGVHQDQPPKLVVADSEGKGIWRKYSTVKDVPQVQLGLGESANISMGTSGVLVEIFEPGEDFSAFTDYCFDPRGNLISMRFALRTAWGWGYCEEGTVAAGSLVVRTKGFFSTQSEKRIAKPQDADEFPEALKPHLYFTTTQLPFAQWMDSP